MVDQTKRPGSITFLLVGLVLLVMVAGLFVTLVPSWECPARRHKWASGSFAWECPLCGSSGVSMNPVTLWRKWTWKPQTPEDWLEFDLNPRKFPEEKK